MLTLNKNKLIRNMPLQDRKHYREDIYDRYIKKDKKNPNEWRVLIV
jgi:hypothetical protein